MAQTGRPEKIKYCVCALDTRLLRLQSHTLNTYDLIILYTKIITLTLLSVTLQHIACLFGVYRLFVVVGPCAYYYVI